MKKEDEAWEYFCANGLSKDFDDNQSNVRYDFTTMTKRFGKSYIDYLKAAYQAKDELSDEDFCAFNGNVPMTFLDKIR